MLLLLVCAQLAAAHDDACGVRAELKASREQRVKEGQELQARMAETRRELSQAPTPRAPAVTAELTPRAPAVTAGLALQLIDLRNGELEEIAQLQVLPSGSAAAALKYSGYS